MTSGKNISWGPKATDFTEMLKAFGGGSHSKDEVLLIANVVRWMMDNVYKEQVKELATIVSSKLKDAKQSIDEAKSGTQAMRILINAVEDSLSEPEEFLVWKYDENGKLVDQHSRPIE